MQALFGEAGRHARSAVGVPVLPLGAAVEVDAIVLRGSSRRSRAQAQAHLRCRLRARRSLRRVDACARASSWMPGAPTYAAMTTVTARIADGVRSIAAADWDACAGDGNPFVGHAFLAALEASGSVGGRSGWQPLPIVVDGADGRPAAIAPAYAKSHSQGEYVFDHGWADAWERAGGDYYPKLQIAAPFSPVPGPRLLLRDPARRARADRARWRRWPTRTACPRRTRPSSSATQVPLFEAAGWLIRAGHAVPLAQRRLCELRRLPRRARQPQAQGDPQGARRRGRGADDPPPDRAPRSSRAHWDAFWPFYQDTGSAQMGAALSDARLLPAAGRGDGRPGAADPGRARRRADRGRAQPDRRRYAVRPLLGRAPRRCRSSISSCAITRRSMPRSRAGWRGSRRARRASTSWRAAMCRCRPGRRITSPIRASAARSPTSCAREREAVAAEQDYLGELTPFRQAPQG